MKQAYGLGYLFVVVFFFAMEVFPFPSFSFGRSYNTLFPSSSRKIFFLDQLDASNRQHSQREGVDKEVETKIDYNRFGTTGCHDWRTKDQARTTWKRRMLKSEQQLPHRQKGSVHSIRERFLSFFSYSSSLFFFWFSNRIGKQRNLDRGSTCAGNFFSAHHVVLFLPFVVLHLFVCLIWLRLSP